MTSKRRLLPLVVALLVCACTGATQASLDIIPTKPVTASDKTPVASVMIDEPGARKKVIGSNGIIESQQRKREPPGSPVTLFTPDDFQFYTLNNNGQLVMKQMSKQEIQGMLAGGGTGLPVDTGHHQTQLPEGEPKVADVVQNVQNVLKGELNKPVQVPSSSSSSIPGNVNSQWTNMLPYILSGGSVDQQDIADDASIILPALDDQSYVDVVPLQNGKPAEDSYEPAPNYVKVQPIKQEEEVKVTSKKPLVGTTEKPIYLLGNMALDSGILGEQETDTPPKRRPIRPTTTSTISPMYQKFTTSRPSFDSPPAESPADNKPTLYIPLSVSPSLLADSQNKDGFEQFNVDQRVPVNGPKPSQFEKNVTKSPDSNPSKPMTSITYSAETGSYAKVPMIQVPIIEADKLSSFGNQQTPIFEILPTISPDSAPSEKEGAHPTKINMGPMGGFKKPGPVHRPTSSYRPVYDPITRPTTDNLTPVTYRPVYEPVHTPNTYEYRPSTYRPIYEPANKQTTFKFSSPTYRPVYEPVTKPSTKRPVYEASSRPSVGTKVTYQYPGSTFQTLTTGKAAATTFEYVTKPSTLSTENKATKAPDMTTETSVRTTEKGPVYEKYPTTASTPKTTSGTDTKATEKETSVADTTTPSSSKSTITKESVDNVSEDKSTSTAVKDTYTTNIISENNAFTTVPVKFESESDIRTTVKSEPESDVRTTVNYVTEKSVPEKLDTTTLKLEPVKSEEETISDDYYTTIMQKETTKEPEDIYTTFVTESMDDYETIAPMVTDKPEINSDDSKKQSGGDKMTTQFIPLEETTLSDDTKKIVKESITSAVPTEYAETVTEYSTMIDKIIDSTQNYNDPLLIEAINSIIGGGVIESKQPAIASVTADSVSELTTLVYGDKLGSKYNVPTTIANENIKKQSTQSATSITEKDDRPSTEGPKTTVYQKLETVTDSSTLAEDKIEISTVSAKQDITQKENEKSTIPNVKITIPYQDDEVSTIKVIPIYDDDESIYTLPPEVLNKATSTVVMPTAYKPTETPTTETAGKITQYTPVQQTNIPTVTDTPSSQTVTSSASSYTTQVPSAQETILPGLEETFNNYMKEHYDSKLSTTGNYDDISHFTTFPNLDEKVSSSDMEKMQTSSTMLDTSTTVNPGSYESKQDSNSDASTIVPNNDSTEATSDRTASQKLDPTTQNTVFEKIQTTEYAREKETTIVPKYPEVTIKDETETPIIHLNLKTSESNKPSDSEQANDENVNDSSMTRIKVKNSVLDIDKIISEAQAQSVTSVTEPYTLPSEYKPPNNIASGLIAGYPTYNEEKPIANYMPSSTTYENIKATDSPITIKKNDEVKQKEENNSYQTIPTTVQSPKDEIKTSSKPTTISENSEITTNNYQTTETPSYEMYTQIPFEKLPLVNKLESTTIKEEIIDQMKDTFNPPFEKINDLINQLKNTPSDRDTIAYDYLNGIATTIVPLERFEEIVQESNATLSDDTLSTIIDSLTKSSAEPQNNTYVVIQTLPPSESYQTSTESLPSSTTRLSTTQRLTTQSVTKQTTQNSLKTESTPSPTTVLTIVKQTVTGKPIVTTTHSTTKAAIEKIQSTIDKSAGRINLEDEKTKMPPMRPTEPSKFTMKDKIHYSTLRRPVNGAYPSYPRRTTKPIIKSTTILNRSTTLGTTTTKQTTTPKPVEESNVDRWTLMPQKNPDQIEESKKAPVNVKETFPQAQSQIVPLDHAKGAIGLDQSSKDQDKDVAEFLNMCNELSFKFWTLANAGLSSSRSVTLSPFGMISTLAMIFLGARGLTSNAMNDILKLDDVVTFNPHLVFQNITDTVTLARGQGIENAAFVRALFADRLKVRKIMPFYKEQAQQFYEGAVVDINFSTAGDIFRRRTNLLIRKQTGGRIKDFVKGHTVPLRSPLTALSANVFQTSCDSADASTEGRDGEMYFAVSQTVKQRKLVPIPAVVWKSGVSAGYEPSLDATAVALGDPKRPVSLIMVMPGQQGVTAHGDNLERLEMRLFGNPSDNALDKLLKVIIPRRVEVQMPKFSHRSILNITSALKKMGFDPLLARTADLKGINGAGHDLFLSEMVQMNLFCTCADDNKPGASRHLSETYPGTTPRHTRAWEILNNINNINNGIHSHSDHSEPQDLERSEPSDKCEEDDTEDLMENPSESSESPYQQLSTASKWSLDKLRQKIQKNRLRWFTSTKRRRCRSKRQAEQTEKPRMKMDKPFLYLIRHNLTGLILHIGRFNPKSQS